MNVDVLYVDDDLANLTVFRAAFGRRFSVLVASSGAEALDLLEKHDVAVLLSDQRMPGMSGVELLRRVRESQPHIERYLVTAYSNLDEAIAAVNEGHIRRYLKKPWEAGEVAAAIQAGIEAVALRRRVAELERRMHEAERIHALGVVAAGIAHELRNPLTSLMLQLELAQPEAEELSAYASREPRLIARLRRATDLAGRLKEILDGMSLTQRREAGAEKADLREVIRLTLACLEGSLRCCATLELALEEVPLVRGGRGPLGQVVMNLLVNAMQSFPEDQPREERRLALRVRAEAPWVSLRVEDNGPGIPPEVQVRLFEPFFTTKLDGGTGLGLAICRRIVEEFGGRIAFTSAPGQGTTFEVLLPVWAPDPPAGLSDGP